jgi:hypothetical protein
MYKKYFATLLIILSLGFVFMGIQPTKLLAAGSVDVLSGPCSNGAAASAACQDDATNSPTNPIYGPNGILTDAILIISWVVGVVSIVIVIISAIRMISSGGDTNAVNSARSALLFALIGVVIAVSAQGIVVFILKKV